MYNVCVVRSSFLCVPQTTNGRELQKLTKEKEKICIQHSRNSMKLKTKMKSGVLKHDIQREFEISKSTYYRFIVREHVLLLKNLSKLKLLLIIFCFNCFHPFLIKDVRSLRVNIDRALIFGYDFHEHFMQLILKFRQYLQHSLFIT